MSARAWLPHAGILAVALAASYWRYTRDPDAAAPKLGDQIVWQLKPADIKAITFDDKSKHVELRAGSDAIGVFLEGTVQRKPKEEKEGPEAAPATDEKLTQLFSATSAQPTLELLAPLRALRALGTIPSERLGEFGLNELEGTLKVATAQGERVLEFGGQTPGGGDRYARDPASGQAYALKGELLRNLQSADSKFVERELHLFKDTDVERATIASVEKTREVVRGGADGKRHWADAASEGTQDETIGNWMTKVDRMRPTSYDPRPDGAVTVVTVTYAGKTGLLGKIELSKAPATEAGKFDYFVMTEFTRKPAKISSATGEQVEQDLGGVLP